MNTEPVVIGSRFTRALHRLLNALLPKHRSGYRPEGGPANPTPPPTSSAVQTRSDEWWESPVPPFVTIPADCYLYVDLGAGKVFELPLSAGHKLHFSIERSDDIYIDLNECKRSDDDGNEK